MGSESDLKDDRSPEEVYEVKRVLVSVVILRFRIMKMYIKRGINKE